MTPYPLQWPVGKPRRDHWSRRRSPFNPGKTPYTPSHARDEVERQLAIWKATGIVISTNYTLSRAPVADPGAAVYFTVEGKARVIACDRWEHLGCNLWAIAKTLEGLRAQERNGVVSGDELLSAFSALPETSTCKTWSVVMGIPATATNEEVEAQYKKFARIYHPNASGGAGNNEKWYELNDAWQQFKQERKLP